MSDDASLYRRWCDDRDPAAFDALARRHADLVTDVAARVAGHADLAEDALQDAFVALARDGTDRPAAVGVRAWLARSAMLAARHRATSDRARARRERAVGAVRATRAAPAEVPVDPDGPAVRDALARLGDGDAAVLTLRFLHGLDYPELAVVLDVAESTARVRVFRALERLRAQPGLSDRDETRLGAAIAALPATGASAPALARAIAAATSVSTSPVAPATAAVASTVRPLLRRLWWAPFALAATVAVVLETAVVLRAMRTPDGPLPVTPTGPPDARGAAEAAGAPLAGRLRAAERAAARNAASEEAPAPPGAGPKPPPPPVPALPATPSAARSRRVEVRFELAAVSGARPIPIAISRLATEFGFAIPFEREGEIAVAQLTDDPIVVATSDERAAVSTIRAIVPEGASAIVASVPARDDPRLDGLTLHVVDATSGAPLPDAELEWLPASGPPEVVRADAQGRLRIRAGTPPSTLEALRLWRWAATVRAPGHRAWTPVAEPLGLDAEVSGAWADRALGTVLAQGGGKVALARYPWPTARARRLRFEDDAGRPVAGAYVGVAFPPTRAMAPFATPNDLGDGFRRTDARGEVEVTFDDLVAVELRFGDAPYAAWGLAADGWPDGPRVLRVPAWADVEIVVTDAIRLTSIGWWAIDPRDALGAARTPLDGPSVEPAFDDTFRARSAAKDLVFPFVHTGVVHHVAEGSPDGATIRCRARVGGPLRLDLRWDFGPVEVMTDSRRRVLDLHPADDRPVRRVVRWDDLPRPR